MINNFKSYNYYTFGAVNSYGQQTLSAEPEGAIKLSIFITSQSIQNNINYSNAQYIAFTNDSNINDGYVIEYGEVKLKVLYVNKQGRYIQVYMSRYD